MKAPVAWRILAAVVGLAGLALALFVLQCAYFLFITRIPVADPIVFYPIYIGLAYLCIHSTYLVFRKHGPRARIQTVVSAAIAIPILGILYAPILLAGDMNDFQDEFLNAVWRGDIATVTKMLDDGENPNKHDSYGNNPMTLAAFAGKTEMVSLLLVRGANIQEQDDSGETPLHCAAYYGHTDTIELLLKMGADVSATNHYGETALQFAALKRFTKAASLLQQHMNGNRTMQSSVPVTRGTPPAKAGAAPESPVR